MNMKKRCKVRKNVYIDDGTTKVKSKLTIKQLEKF